MRWARSRPAWPRSNRREGATGSKSMWTFTHDNLKEHPHVEFVIKVGDKTFNSNKWHADEGDH